MILCEFFFQLCPISYLVPYIVFYKLIISEHGTPFIMGTLFFFSRLAQLSRASISANKSSLWLHCTSLYYVFNRSIGIKMKLVVFCRKSSIILFGGVYLCWYRVMYKITFRKEQLCKATRTLAILKAKYDYIILPHHHARKQPPTSCTHSPSLCRQELTHKYTHSYTSHV